MFHASREKCSMSQGQKNKNNWRKDVYILFILSIHFNNVEPPSELSWQETLEWILCPSLVTILKKETSLQCMPSFIHKQNERFLSAIALEEREKRIPFCSSFVLYDSHLFWVEPSQKNYNWQNKPNNWHLGSHL